ncbi:MAG: 16S rRNA (guanine(527)-N(7))-methyltransferase RsmG [Bacteroidota bacterium]
MQPLDESIVFQHFDTLSPSQQAQFSQIAPVYQTWNNKLNLISRQDIDHLYLKHVLHSLGIAKVVDFKAGTRILDVGTGGGFPGIPLAIMFPQVEFHLIDSIGKKIRAVQHIATELGLANVTTQQVRAENLETQYDFILGRAVTSLATFYGWVKNNMASTHQNLIPNGILYLKGIDTHLETIPLQRRIYAIRDFFADPFFETKQLVHLYA